MTSKLLVWFPSEKIFDLFVYCQWIFQIQFRKVFLFYQIFLSPKVKGSVISHKNPYIRVIPHINKWRNPKDLWKLGKYRKFLNVNGIITYCPSLLQNKNSIKAVTELLETRSWTFPVVCYFTWISKFVRSILFRTKRNQPSNLHCTSLTCFLSYNKTCTLNCSRVTYGIKITGWFSQCLACFLFHFISVSFLFHLFSCHIETGWKIFITTRSLGFKWII